MRTRRIIAVQTGALVGLLILTWIQARKLRQAHFDLEDAVLTVPEVSASTNARPLRLRLQSIPPITIRSEVRVLDWNSVESDDYATYIANLRKIGCPEETIRDILLADINKLFAARRRALPAPRGRTEFWRHPDEWEPDAAAAALEKEHSARLTALERERRTLLLTLLGDAAIQADLKEYATEFAESPEVQFLPDDKRKAIAEAHAQWRLAHEEAESATDPAEAARLRAEADRAFDEAESKVLTPQEAEEYEMRSDPLADELRDRLRGFGASRDEFEKLYRLEKQFALERAGIRTTDGKTPDRQWEEETEASLLEQRDKIREMLGPERFAVYERSSDPDYQTLYSLTREHSISPAIANEVWTMRHAVEAQTDRIRQNPFLTAEQKTRAFEAIRAETQAAIVEVMGEPLLQAYQQEGGGWLVDLTEPTDLGVTDQPMTPPPLPGVPDDPGVFFPVPLR